MKNKFFAILTALILCLTLFVPACAAEAHIFDNTGIMDALQISNLEQKAKEFEEKYNFTALISIIDGVGDEGTYGYTEALYLTNAQSENGIALTYNYGDNNYAFYCGEEALSFISENEQGELWNAFAYSETYYDGCYEYFTALEALVSAYSVENQPAAPSENSETEVEDTTEFVPVDRTLGLVEDYADVLSDEEEAALTERLELIGQANNLEIGAVTVNGYEGKTPTAFADDFYDYNGYGYGENDDGLIVVFNTGIDDGDRNIAISTHGRAIDLVTDMEIDIIIEMMIPLIKNGDYAGAFDSFANECESSLETGISVFWIPASLVIGFAIAFVIVKMQASKLNTIRQQVDASDYVSNVVVSEVYDNFIYRDIKKVPKPKESSSTHTSSSGRTHGGGNKSF